MRLMHKCSEVFVSSTTHVCKLGAHANRKFHADKSFGGLAYLR